MADLDPRSTTPAPEPPGSVDVGALIVDAGLSGIGTAWGVVKQTLRVSASDARWAKPHSVRGMSECQTIAR
jgi:hypothetical protein